MPPGWHGSCSAAARRAAAGRPAAGTARARAWPAGAASAGAAEIGRAGVRSWRPLSDPRGRAEPAPIAPIAPIGTFGTFGTFGQSSALADGKFTHLLPFQCRSTTMAPALTVPTAQALLAEPAATP
jgi:hypothetical protein